MFNVLCVPMRNKYFDKKASFIFSVEKSTQQLTLGDVEITGDVTKT